LVLLLGFSIIGFVDDFVVPKLIKGTRGLGWKQKIVMQIVVAVLAAWMVNRGTGAAGEGSSLLSMAGTVFLILFFSNAYNFSDGLDGLAGSLLLGLAAGLVPIVLIVGADPALAVVVVALVGALLPFLYLNAPPARVFMGDVGSLPIGAVLGYVIGSLGTASHYVHGIAGQSATGEVFSYATHEVRTAPLILALFVLSLMMVAELVPVPLQILSVKVRKKKLFPYTPIHHAFEKAGWKETHVVAMFALLQLLFSALAISLALFAAPSMLGSRP
jgi:phospho-N-acetylmuramoyl-pentapeptide-transferase